MEEVYNITLATYYQLETQIRIQTNIVDKGMRSVAYNLLDKSKERFLSGMNAAMRQNERPNFIGSLFFPLLFTLTTFSVVFCTAFSMLLEPLSTDRWDVPLYASYSVYAFVTLCVVFALAGGVHGFVYWGADNVRISGIILFGSLFSLSLFPLPNRR